MSQFLNQIFYPSHTFDTVESLKRLDDFMLTYSTVDKSVSLQTLSTSCSQVETKESEPELKINKDNDFIQDNNKLDEEKLDEEKLDEIKIEKSHHHSQKPKKELSKKKGDFFYPRREDSLFWCLFISHHGLKEFLFIGKKYGNKEMEEKQRIMDTLKKTPAELKNSNYKVSNVLIQEILSDLLIHKTTTMSTLLAFVAFYKKKVFLTSDKTYLYYSYNKDLSNDVSLGDVVIIHYDTETKLYGIDMNITQDKVNNIIINKFLLDHFNKPLKGVSTYKVSELETISDKLGICKEDMNLYRQRIEMGDPEGITLQNVGDIRSSEFFKGLKKQDLYQLIYQECIKSFDF